ncbi:MAG: PhnE/PtxC family ABC transporter permease [Gaiellales bacterium]
MSAATATEAVTGVIVPRSRRVDRLAWLVAVLALVGWSIARAQTDVSAIVNTRGWPSFADFFAAAVRPELGGAFLSLVARETLTTLAYATLGTALAIVIGLFGGVVLAETTWRPLSGRFVVGRLGWIVSRVALGIPRSVHEVVFALLLLSVLGLDPLVAVLAIGLPFGAVTAKVFAEIIDETSGASVRALRAAGATRLGALAYGVLPGSMPDLVSYGFYRFECAIRAAAVLGIVGAGGLGFQLALSFQSLRYEEMWTLLFALILLSGVADVWSSVVRRRYRNPDPGRCSEGVPGAHRLRRDRVLIGSGVLFLILVPLSWWWTGLSLSSLVSERTRALLGDLAGGTVPPRLPGGLAPLVGQTLDTLALAVLSIGIAFVLASLVAFAAAGPTRPRRGLSRLRSRVVVVAARGVLLTCRAIPPPVWALLFLFVLFPGIWPGAVALGIYNFGVLGRLMSDVVQNLDDRPARALAAQGATGLVVRAYSTVPQLLGRFVALGQYRWEVAVRETVVVGVVGAAGLGRLLDEQLSSFDYAAVTSTLIALVVLTVTVDLASAALRRSLR